MLKVGQNLTVMEVGEDDWILVADSGQKFRLPYPADFDGKPIDRVTDLCNVIHDIGAEGPDDPYAKVVLPLIERILADDYTGTGLFEAIDRELKLVETDPQLEAEIEAEEADIKAIQADAGLAQ